VYVPLAGYKVALRGNVVKPSAAGHQAVLQAVEEHALTPEAVEQVIRLTERDDLHEQQRKIWSEATALRPVPRLHPSVVESRLAEWRRLLRQSATQGRAVLQRVLRGRLTFWPRADGQGYDFAGATRFDRLLRASWRRDRPSSRRTCGAPITSAPRTRSRATTAGYWRTPSAGSTPPTMSGDPGGIQTPTPSSPLPVEGRDAALEAAERRRGLKR